MRGDVERARGEGDDAPLDVANRDDEAAAEATAPAERVRHAVDAEEEARLGEGVLAITFGEQSRDELGIVDGRETDTEVIGDLEGELTLLGPVVANPFAVHGILEEAAAPVVGDEFVDLEELAAERFLVLAVAAGLVVELEAEAGGDAFDGLREVEPFAGHDQFEGVAALLGGEAIPEAGLGVDLERGAFL